MPAPADVQAYNGGATIGKAEHNDSITFTFASAVNPALILPGWNGASTTVSIHFQHNSSNDILSVRNDSTGALLAELGAVEMKANYTHRQLRLHELADDRKRQHGHGRVWYGGDRSPPPNQRRQGSDALVDPEGLRDRIRRLRHRLLESPCVQAPIS